MRDMRLIRAEPEPANAGKIIAAVIIGLGVVAAGVHMYETGQENRPIVSDSNLPSPGPVLKVTPKTPPHP